MKQLQDHASNWAADRLVVGDVPAQIDLDELSDEQPPSDAVSTALACGGAILALVRELGQEVDVAVVIPLNEVGTEMVRSSPTLTVLAASAWDYGPGREVPRIYGVPPSVWVVVEQGEEYRRVLDDP